MKVVCLAPLDRVPCLLDLGTLAVEKTILLFIQGKDAAISVLNNERNLCCHLAFSMNLSRFPF